MNRCFDYGKPLCYPELPEGDYLVACADNFVGVRVFAVYTLAQMQQLSSKEANGWFKKIEWRVLEISKELESALLKDASQNVSIITAE